MSLKACMSSYSRLFTPITRTCCTNNLMFSTTEIGQSSKIGANSFGATLISQGQNSWNKSLAKTLTGYQGQKLKKPKRVKTRRNPKTSKARNYTKFPRSMNLQTATQAWTPNSASSKNEVTKSLWWLLPITPRSWEFPRSSSRSMPSKDSKKPSSNSSWLNINPYRPISLSLMARHLKPEWQMSTNWLMRCP